MTKVVGTWFWLRWSLYKKREYGRADFSRCSWLESLDTSELQACSKTLFLSRISIREPIRFSPLARVRFRPNIVGSTTNLTG